ncbi:hypothetical protein BaRGS_00000779, partial [Batillaria attramentaria]
DYNSQSTWLNLRKTPLRQSNCLPLGTLVLRKPSFKSSPQDATFYGVSVNRGLLYGGRGGSNSGCKS